LIENRSFFSRYAPLARVAAHRHRRPSTFARQEVDGVPEIDAIACYLTGFKEDGEGDFDISEFEITDNGIGMKRDRVFTFTAVRASVRVEEGSNPKIAISQLTPLEEAQPKLPRSIRIRMPLETATEATVDALQAICHERKGEAKVLFDVERQGEFMVVMEAEGYNVLPDRNFIARVEQYSGLKLAEAYSLAGDVPNSYREAVIDGYRVDDPHSRGPTLDRHGPDKI
jgi:hypothetical protein